MSITELTTGTGSEMEDIPPPLLLTDAAAAKVKSLVEEEDNDDLKLRVFVTGGG